MADENTWGRVKSDVDWSMTNPGADSAGQQMMCDAARRGNVNFMGEFKNGFHKVQSDTGVLAEFDDCAQQNQGRLYNIGRAAINLPPV